MEFPLGQTHQLTPAASPLPGHLLASTGPAGHPIAGGLPALAGLAIAASLAVRPPTGIRAATARLAPGLTLLFTLAPATRSGYFAYPAGLLGWLALACPAKPPRPATSRWTLARAGRAARPDSINEPPEV